MNDKFLQREMLKKTNTVRVDAFGAGELGLLGYVDEDGVWFYRQSTKRHTFDSEFDIDGITQLPRVDIVSSYAGADGLLVEVLAEHGVPGIILQGTGAGGVTPELETAANNSIEKGTIVVTSTRVNEGRLRESSVDVGIRADNLTPQKARILLMLALTKTKNPAEIQRMFLEY
jgi:L-asparaginase